MKRILIYVFLFLVCQNINAQEDTAIYSFFAAGHTYGNPNSPHLGLHYPFVDFFPYLNSFSNMNFGIFTGDVVVFGTAEYWDAAQEDIDKLNMPIYIAAGNHDMGSEFTSRFGNYYYSFLHKDDLFIVLTPGLNSWNISGNQLEFLENTLDSNHAFVDNIFIFMHELIWWSPTNEYQAVEINYASHYPGSTNFDTIVKPLLLSYSNNITIYAGDLGCTNSVSPFMYHHFDNVTLIGSGMGGGVRDNIIITNVFEDSVYYDLVAINGLDQNALGEIYEYILNTESIFQFEYKISIFPNPANQGFFYIENEFHIDFQLHIYDLLGKKVHSSYVQKNSTAKVETKYFNSGVFFLHLLT